MPTSITAATLTSVTTDTGINTDFITSDTTLILGGSVTTSGTGLPVTLFIYLEGSGFTGAI